MEADASRFYSQAAGRATDAAAPKLLGDLAETERGHMHTAADIEEKRLPGEVRGREDEDARKRFVLHIVQPGLAGLMDGSVSTLAPVFAAAFATHSTWNTFLVGLAATVGAGISMGFAEARADDGKLSGRGTPLLRGLVCGPGVLDCHDCSGLRRGRRTRHDRLHPIPVYGDPRRLGHC
jgi:rubrerythrin